MSIKEYPQAFRHFRESVLPEIEARLSTWGLVDLEEDVKRVENLSKKKVCECLLLLSEQCKTVAICFRGGRKFVVIKAAGSVYTGLLISRPEDPLFMGSYKIGNYFFEMIQGRLFFYSVMTVAPNRPNYTQTIRSTLREVGLVNKMEKYRREDPAPWSGVVETMAGDIFMTEQGVLCMTLLQEGGDMSIGRLFKSRVWVMMSSGERIRHLWQMTRDLLQGVCTLHRYGIIHRDIKPRNCVVKWDHAHSIYRLLLIDFGYAIEEGELLENTPSEFVGSPYMFDPHIVRRCRKNKPVRHLVGKKSDIWSTGLVVFKLWGERVPSWCNAKTNEALYSRLAVLSQQEVNLEVRTKCSRAIAGLLQCLLQVRQQRRLMLDRLPFLR
ncbi:MAG: hypothetical protein A3F09_05595 [Chlamydiae bacterium RIFCSPHIGHO2_12_FULL_49_11]|nr:MAG: hypothetical protein A3F09_05595 [Chlamydiae bacterium RIFCSPHIGHO2_12_FULL_49_11]